MKLLTEQEIQERLAEVATLRVALDPDPMNNGIGSINKKISELQLYKDRLSYLITEALHNSNTAEIEYEQLKGEYDRQLQTLLATDSTVMSGKSADARSAAANQKMPELVLKVHFSELEKLKSSGYLNVLKNIYSNLESCNSNLSRQITVLQMSMQLDGIQRSSNGFPQGQIVKTS
jgi:hypothetical protein